MVYPNLIDNKKRAVKHGESILKGSFPSQSSIYPTPKIFKINFILAFSLIIAVILSMVSYLGIIAKDNEVKNLHFSTNKINYENMDLQNRVDYMKSFYALDNKVKKIDFLKKADKVMEVEKRNKIPAFLDAKKYFDVTSVPGY